MRQVKSYTQAFSRAVLSVRLRRRSDRQLGSLAKSFSNRPRRTLFSRVDFESEPTVYYSLSGYKGISPDPNGSHTRIGAEKLGPVQITAGQPLFSDFVRLALSAKRDKKKTQDALNRIFSRLEIA